MSRSTGCTSSFELSEPIRRAAVTTPRVAKHVLCHALKKLLTPLSSERWIDDIGDITYARCGKARIPFSEMEEYCADNGVSAE
jgi:hypothetical protein